MGRECVPEHECKLRVSKRAAAFVDGCDVRVTGPVRV